MSNTPDPKPFDMEAAIARNLALFEQLAAARQWERDLAAAELRMLHSRA